MIPQNRLKPSVLDLPTHQIPLSGFDTSQLVLLINDSDDVISRALELEPKQETSQDEPPTHFPTTPFCSPFIPLPPLDYLTPSIQKLIDFQPPHVPSLPFSSSTFSQSPLPLPKIIAPSRKGQ
ncbi:hypothetical protein RCL1_005238 [Eukaryota sp. TZLM3-RCL]